MINGVFVTGYGGYIMSSLRIAVFLAVVLVVLIDWSIALPTADKERLLNEVRVNNQILRKKQQQFKEKNNLHLTIDRSFAID